MKKRAKAKTKTKVKAKDKGKEVGEKFAPSLAGSGGWDRVSPSSVKLYISLAAAGRTVKGTLQQIAQRSGLTKRTAITCMAELQALGWVDHKGKAGIGSTWTVKRPPKRMRQEAFDFYRWQLDKKRWGLELQEHRLLADKLRTENALLEDEAAEVTEKINELERQIAASGFIDPDLVEEELQDISEAIRGKEVGEKFAPTQNAGSKKKRGGES